MKFVFSQAPRPPSVDLENWNSWHWQLQKSIATKEEFAKYLKLHPQEIEGFENLEFQVRATPYYLSLLSQSGDSDSSADSSSLVDPIRQMILPSHAEKRSLQHHVDPLAEDRYNPAPRIIHRYPDRVLFLVTDVCSVYCRYCTRKHFTGMGQSMVDSADYHEALGYVRSHPEIREVILSGGDPLTLSDGVLDRILGDLRNIEHIEIIRVGSRMPVVCPMRITPKLIQTLRRYSPVYMMTHFNHPLELTEEAVTALALFVDHGIPVFNQMVLLNGVNNHPAVVQALCRRLVYLRVKPYYMFQCDPSKGSDHLRTSVQESMEIQRSLWGTLSGLALPTLSLDIPNGGGKTTLVPDFLQSHDIEAGTWQYEGWDGVKGIYRDPAPSIQRRLPSDWEAYNDEWRTLRDSRAEQAVRAPTFDLEL